MALPKRSAPVSPVVPNEQLFYDKDFADMYPALHSFLKDTNYEDGTRRLTGTISLFVKNGRLTCGVNDNDRQLTAYVNAVTVEEMLFSVNEGIANDTLEWKAKTPFVPGKQIPF